jgi:hypothetical protein
MTISKQPIPKNEKCIIHKATRLRLFGHFFAAKKG